MIQEKPRLIDKAAANLDGRRQAFSDEVNNITLVLGNCSAAEQIIIECKEIFEDTHNGKMVSPKDRANIGGLLDEIDYFLNKEADNEN